MSSQKEDFVRPVTLELVRDKVLAYQKHMRGKLGPDEKQFLQFYIDKDALARMARISMMEGFDCIGVYFGLSDADCEGKENPLQVTACFVGVDKDKNILKQIRDKSRQQALIVVGNNSGGDAEDTWQPPPSDGDDGGAMPASDILRNKNILRLDGSVK